MAQFAQLLQSKTLILKNAKSISITKKFPNKNLAASLRSISSSSDGLIFENKNNFSFIYGNEVLVPEPILPCRWRKLLANCCGLEISLCQGDSIRDGGHSLAQELGSSFSKVHSMFYIYTQFF